MTEKEIAKKGVIVSPVELFGRFPLGPCNGYLAGQLIRLQALRAACHAEPVEAPVSAAITKAKPAISISGHSKIPENGEAFWNAIKKKFRIYFF
jgi:hypothetical protein